MRARTRSTSPKGSPAATTGTTSSPPTAAKPAATAGAAAKAARAADATAEPRARRTNGSGAETLIGAANSTAERAIDILLLFNEEKPLWSASEIATHFGMPKSTVYRYVNSLRSYALIEEDGQNGFRLGPRIFPLARTAKGGMTIVKIAQPHLRALADSFGEMVVLQQRMGYDIVALERISSPQRVSLASTRSHLLPWPATGSAKLLLALAPQAERDEIMKIVHPTSYTGSTLQSKAALKLDLDRIRERGYSVTDEERDEGVWGMAAAVYERGEAKYAVAIAAPKFRMTAAKMAAITEAVRAAAAAITTDLAATDF